MKDYKGTALKFDEPSYNRTIVNYGPVLSRINKVAEAYESLDSTFKFNDEVFQDVIKFGAKNIAAKYSERIEEQIQASKFTSNAIVNSMRQNVSNELQDLESKIKEMHDMRHSQMAGLSANYPIEYEYIAIESGKAVLTSESKEKIRETFTLRVNTEAQSTLYNHLLNLKSNYEALTSFMKENDHDLAAWGEIISPRFNGLCYEQKGELIIIPEAITIKLKK